MTDYHSLKRDSKYLFQLIKRVDGTMCKPFISTPKELCEFLKSQDEFTMDDLYVNFLIDVGYVNECLPDESASMADLVMCVPLFSAKAFLVLMDESDGALGDLSQYDESVKDSDFNTPKEDDVNE